jgi:predicted metal-dependent hydrolase
MILKSEKNYLIKDIEFSVIYSRRRSLAISVLTDSSVIVRVPYLTSQKTINRIVTEKYDWILKHRDNYKKRVNIKPSRLYANEEYHLFRGNEYLLKVEKSKKPSVRFYFGTIEVGLSKTDDPKAIKLLLYQGYKNEALIVLPEILNSVIRKHNSQMFKPSGLIIRTMKRRWGSCSSKGVITLSTELIKLSDLFIEYVIIHELCHLKHHNHGVHFYKLLSEIYPNYKSVRKEMRKYIH